MQSMEIKDVIGACDFYMHSYIDMIQRDYKHGWEDCARNRSNLYSSDAYMQGYEDCKYEKNVMTKTKRC